MGILKVNSIQTLQWMENITNVKMKNFGIIAGLILLLSAQTSWAQDSKYYKGQALFIWNFTKHIKWQSSTDNFIIGVYGKSDITTELTTNLKGKLVDSKPVDIKSVNSISEATQCQIIYVPTSKSKELAGLLSAVASKDILVITEDDLANKGAGISFILIEDKLRFKINQETLSKGGLQVSGGLLSLAVKI